ncbi:YhgE/Pip domain-containing protein [Nocardia jejuensis]|uniref:YhgE/Pip domain-containing protein n=1 Tax=Nocardia jejuensis TaxID=328049 RepID=UPI000A048996|nr:ABC transporter permease [Nocardia jejuensis]
MVKDTASSGIPTGTATTGGKISRTGVPLRRWIAPVFVVTLLAALLGTMYLGYTSDPEKNLHDFPIALVNQDDGDSLDGRAINIGDQISAALTEKIPADKIDLRTVGYSEARRLLQDGQVYGAIVIPSDFSKRLSILAAASVVPGDVERPFITVHTNPRAGTYAAQIVQRVSDRAMAQVNSNVGTQLTDQVRAKLQPAPGVAPTELSGAARLQLATPIDIVVSPYHPLPEGTGQGLSAFFYTLILLFAGFSGAMIIHAMVDNALGYVPAEYGPWYRHIQPVAISRWRTLLVKWAMAVVTAPIVSAIFLGIATLLDMPIDHTLTLFLYGTLAVAAVCVTGLSILAAFGTAGLLINMIVFVILGLPSSSGTIPIEATPRYIANLAHFEPMHQIYLAVRAILFFDGHLESGLGTGLWMTVFGLALGLLLGAVATHTYDLRGLYRLGVPHRSEPAVAVDAK